MDSPAAATVDTTLALQDNASVGEWNTRENVSKLEIKRVQN